MDRCIRLASIILGLASLVCLVLGVAMWQGWLDPPHPATLFIVDSEVKDFGEAAVGANPVLTFKFRNDNDREVEIIGGNFG